MNAPSESSEPAAPRSAALTAWWGGVVLAGWFGLAEGLLDLRGQDARTLADASGLLVYAVASWLVAALLAGLPAAALTLLICAVVRRLRPAVLVSHLGAAILWAAAGIGVGGIRLLGMLLAARLAGRVLPGLRGRTVLGLAVGLVFATGMAGALVSRQGRPELTPAEAEGPPVILVVVDALRADALSCYRAARVWGDVEPTGVETPHLDALAAEGWMVPDAVSSSSWTLPSVATLLTGVTPRRHGVSDHDALLPAHLPTLAGVLGEHGYASAAVVGNPILRPDRGFLRGFEQVLRQPHEFEGSLRWILRLNELAVDQGWITGPDAGRKLALPTWEDGRLGSRRTGYLAADEVTDAGLQVLDERGADGTLLYLHYFDPHDPYQEHPRPLWPRHPEYDEDSLDELVQRYDGEVAFLDEQLGRLFDGLRERGVYDRALIVVTADHGEEFLDHGGFKHGASLHDELVRVPLLVRFPGGVQPGAAPQTATLADLLPTIARVVNVDPGPAEAFDGHDLVAVSQGQRPPAETRVTERVQSGTWLAGVRTPTRDFFASLPPGFPLLPPLARAWEAAVRERLDPYGQPDPPFERVDLDLSLEALRIPPAARDLVDANPDLQLLPAPDGRNPLVRTASWTPARDGLLLATVRAWRLPDGPRLRVFVERRVDDAWSRDDTSVVLAEGPGLVRTAPVPVKAGESVRLGLGTLPPLEGEAPAPEGSGWTIFEASLGLDDPRRAFRFEAYDRARDPAQLQPLEALPTADLADLLEVLRHFGVEGRSEARRLDSSELERFREIGYVGDDG